MTRLAISLLGTALAALSTGCAEPGPPAFAIDPIPAAEQGAQLFIDPSVSEAPFNVFSCATCHEREPGEAGGRILPGAPLAGVTQRPSYWGGREIELLSAINQCLTRFMYHDDPWSRDDADAQLVYAYLDSLDGGDEGKAPVPFTIVTQTANVPDGDPDRGSGLYAAACATCHGELRTGEGRIVDYAPILPDDSLAAHPPEEYTMLERRLVFVEKIQHGSFLGAGGQMPPFSREKLSDEDIGDLLAYFGVL